MGVLRYFWISSRYLRDEFVFDSGVIVEKLLVSWKALVLLRGGREAVKKDLEHSMFSCLALLYNKYHSKNFNPFGILLKCLVTPTNPPYLAKL